MTTRCGRRHSAARAEETRQDKTRRDDDDDGGGGDALREAPVGRADGEAHDGELVPLEPEAAVVLPRRIARVARAARVLRGPQCRHPAAAAAAVTTTTTRAA
jgi:hypothetical protein